MNYKKSPTCSLCGREHNAPHYYCNPCRAQYNRDRRKTTTITETQKDHHRIRQVAIMFAKRNDLAFSACADCGPVDRIEFHHPDYSKPHSVVPLCRKCHLKRHRVGKGEDSAGVVNLWNMRTEAIIQMRFNR